MATDGALVRGREAFAARAWSDAYRELAGVDANGPLAPDDLERLALAALLTGQDDVADDARERAHYAHLGDGDAEGAARAAFWLALTLTLRGEPARGSGWFGRAQRVLDDAAVEDSVWRGFLLIPAAMNRVFSGDPHSALPLTEQALAFGKRYGNVDLCTFARHGHGHALVASGDTAAGLAELDEVMVAVTTSDDIYPQLVGLVYCAVIQVCRDSFDVRRGQEWTDALSRWCAAQPDLVPYRGQCQVHRAEILQLHGSWPDAMAEISRLCQRFADGTTELAAGMAFYQRGELHRVSGESTEAEDAYRRAAQFGHDPQPGAALLRLARGQLDSAYAAIRRALDEASRPTHRPRLLSAYVEIALAAGDLEAARTAADELAAAAGRLDVPLLAGAALHARGAVQLGGGDCRAALNTLRRAVSAWQDIAAPYDAARSRVLIARACQALGDQDGAVMELEAARWTFQQLGAAADLALIQRGQPAPQAAPGGLTLREAQVLRLVATGATNRAIAGELFLSDKTVARHVANIFLKLNVSSRSAATAYAYDNHLV